MPPIRKGDGTGLAPKAFAEVRKGDGTVLYSASSGGVPDATDLQTRYDLSVEDGSMPISDQTGNGYDLGNGSYTGVGTTINGLQAGEYDGVDDSTWVTFSEVSQPTTIAMVVQLDATTSGSNLEWFDGDSGATHLIRSRTFNGEFNIYGGNTLNAGVSEDTNPHIFVCLFNGTSSVIRIDGTEAATGDAGSLGLDGVTLGSRGDQSLYAPIRIGEVLVYPQDKSSIFGDIESYLSDKWGVTLS